MPITDFLKKLENRLRGLAEAPFEEVHHPLTLRQKVLHAIEDRVEAEGGPQVLNARRLTVFLWTGGEQVHPMLPQLLVQQESLAEEVRQHLREIGMADPDRLHVEVQLASEAEAAPPGLAERGFALAWDAPGPGAAERPVAQAEPVCRLTIEKGRATREVYTFQAPAVVHVGRMEEVIDEAGHITRRNEVAFLDEEDEINATVSRSHAHIRYEEPAACYRLVDEDSACGTSIYRAGESGLIPVKRRGVVLQDGDLLYFGKACARFELG